MSNRITSTITTTTANVMRVNVANGEVFNEQMFIPETATKDNATMLKFLNKHKDDENTKSVAIMSVETTETLRATTLEKFIANSLKIEKRITSLNGSKVLTRTFIETTANVMRVNVANGEVFNEQMFIPETATKDNATMLKFLNKHKDDDNTKSVAIMSVETTETLRGITEENFVAISEVIEKR